MNDDTITNEWKSIVLGDVCRVQGGFAFKSDDYVDDTDSVPLIRIGDLQDGRVSIGHNAVRLPASFLKDESLHKYLLTDGDVLIAMTGATTGKLARYQQPGEAQAFLNQRVGRIFPISENVILDFIFFSGQTTEFQKQIVENILAAAQGNISPSKLESLRLLLPALPEQRKIAGVLGLVQRAIEQQERLIALTTELKKALLHKLFTEGLRGEPQKQTEIGPVPESWEVVKIEDLVVQGVIAKPMDGNHGNIHPKSADFVERGIPFVMASDLTDGTIDFKGCAYLRKQQADRLQKGFAHEGDILISHKATIGVTAIVPKVEDYVMLTPQVTYYRVLDKHRLNNIYLKAFFDSSLFQEKFHTVARDGSTRSYIGITKQRELLIALPGLDEQVDIANCLALVERKCTLAMKKSAVLTALFRTLLHQLMTAQIRVHDLDVGELEATGTD